MPISEARARLTELADEVVGAGTEKVPAKDGASFVAIVDARKLDTTTRLKKSTLAWSY